MPLRRPSLVQAKDHLRGLAVGEKLAVVEREGKPSTFIVTPKAISKPMSNANNPAARAVMGVVSGDWKKSGGVEITDVTIGGADKAGIKSGDVVLSIDEKKIDEANGLRDALGTKKPGDLIKIAVHHPEQQEPDRRQQ